ncbi:MAG: glycosyltransferase family 2 protein [Desulfosoma sp.]|uniref:glycosyltransferase family 2 protein n=1 Tax=Desulfosoma sp. TaxID=2603217 RepID=UPI00404B5DAA
MVPKDDQPLELSIVMPCLNEARTLEACIQKATNFLQRAEVHGEVIVADNGSTDGSVEIARNMGAQVVHVAEKGYGSALMGGIAAARGTYIIMGDSDDSYDFLHLDAFLTKLREGYDLVVGNRFLGGIRPGAMPLLHRYVGNPVLSFLGNLFFRSNVGDFHCGLRGFRKDAFTALDLKTTGMEFASEMIVKASLHGLRMAEVPTILHPDGRNRPSHLKTWRDGWRHLRFLLLYSPTWLFFYPGLFLTLVSLLVLLTVALHPLQLGGLVLDIHTLAYAAFGCLVGLEAVTFYVVSTEYAYRRGMLPVRPDMLSRIFRIPLEYGIAAGLFLFLLGFAGALYSLLVWKAAHFKTLDPTRVMRLVIPAGLLMASGMQVVFSSFLISVFRIGAR